MVYKHPIGFCGDGNNLGVLGLIHIWAIPPSDVRTETEAVEWVRMKSYHLMYSELCDVWIYYWHWLKLEYHCQFFIFVVIFARFSNTGQFHFLTWIYNIHFKSVYTIGYTHTHTCLSLSIYIYMISVSFGMYIYIYISISFGMY